jgi:hypothetical protein
MNKTKEEGRRRKEEAELGLAFLFFLLNSSFFLSL